MSVGAVRLELGGLWLSREGWRAIGGAILEPGRSLGAHQAARGLPGGAEAPDCVSLERRVQGRLRAGIGPQRVVRGPVSAPPRVGWRLGERITEACCL